MKTVKGIKNKKKVEGKAVALAVFTLWLKKAPKLKYAIVHSKTAFVIHASKGKSAQIKKI